jgi:hypothetical protein
LPRFGPAGRIRDGIRTRIRPGYLSGLHERVT